MRKYIARSLKKYYSPMKSLKTTLGKSLPFVTAVWAAFCPICYIAPLLIGVGAGSTLVFTALIGEKLLIVFIVISLLGFYLSYRTHKNLFPIALGIVAGILMYYGRYINYNLNLSYIGSVGIIGAAIMDIFLKRRHKDDCESCKDIVKGEHKWQNKNTI